MNILFVWTGVAGYMGDCWRALAQMPDVRLRILIQERRFEATSFKHEEILKDLDYSVLFEDERLNGEVMLAEISRFCPDVIFIVGWRAKLSRWVATARAFRNIPKVLIFDLPFIWSFKKLVAPVVLHTYLRRFQGCFVPGEKAARYARWLGFREVADLSNKPSAYWGIGWIQKGLFAANIVKFEGLFQRRATLRTYPRQFLYVGRYVKEKGIKILVAAYARYRQRLLVEVENIGGDIEPWGLTCCGTGPLAQMLSNQPRIQDIGFHQPDELPEIFLHHGAFVIASIHEPWGVVIAEAAAAGLPIVCTEVCGAAADVVEGNGILCKTNDVESLSDAMLKIHAMSDQERVVMGQKGLGLVKPYSCEAWSERVRECVGEVLKKF